MKRGFLNFSRRNFTRGPRNDAEKRETADKRQKNGPLPLRLRGRHSAPRYFLRTAEEERGARKSPRTGAATGPPGEGRHRRIAVRNTHGRIPRWNRCERVRGGIVAKAPGTGARQDCGEWVSRNDCRGNCRRRNRAKESSRKSQWTGRGRIAAAESLRTGAVAESPRKPPERGAEEFRKNLAADKESRNRKGAPRAGGDGYGHEPF